MLGFAFAAHVVSILDAMRQCTFPGLNVWATRLGVSGGLGLGVYAPVITVVSLVAWPGVRSGPEAEGYLVNCWAYRATDPSRDDWVWFHPTAWSEASLGRVVAGPGQLVEWSESRLSVDGEPSPVDTPARSLQRPQELSYRVPAGHVLIRPGGWPGDRREPEGLVIVDRSQVIGRAWARLYPIRERQWMPRSGRPDGLNDAPMTTADSHT
jgi:hypothetical protein